MSLLLKVTLSAFSLSLIFLLAVDNFAQVKYPRPSQRQVVEQSIGDTEIRILYHRPNVSGRIVFGDEGAIVPFGRIWRAGANEATVFEFTNDVTVNGMPLVKGKYSFYVIPTSGAWTVIFNRSWNQWGTDYDQAEDAVRFAVTPIVSSDNTESLEYSFESITRNNARVVLKWEKMRLPFVIDVGDVSARILTAARREMINGPVNAANYVLNQEITESYEEALEWLDSSLSMLETYGALFAKSRILGELGRREDAIAAGEKALDVGRKSSVNPRSLEFLESLIRAWRTEQ